MKKLLLLVSFLLTTQFANAMDFSHYIGKSGQVLIYAEGDINEGDADKLERYLNNFKNRKIYVILDSDGGYVIEALRIGLLININNANTVVGTKRNKRAHCASACALAFFGGHNRIIMDNGLLGVHQMRSEAKNARESEIAAQVATSHIYNYADAVNMPREVLKVMFKTPSNDMFYISPNDARSIGIQVLSSR